VGYLSLGGAWAAAWYAGLGAPQSRRLETQEGGASAEFEQNCAAQTGERSRNVNLGQDLVEHARSEEHQKIGDMCARDPQRESSLGSLRVFIVLHFLLRCAAAYAEVAGGSSHAQKPLEARGTSSVRNEPLLAGEPRRNSTEGSQARSRG